MKTITAYRCSHCPTAKITVTERSMKRHEADCIHNPDVKSCPTCLHDGRTCAIGMRTSDQNLIRHCLMHFEGVAE